MPRPLDFLEKSRVIYPIKESEKTSNLRAAVQTDEKIYAIAGQEIWKQMVEGGSLSGMQHNSIPNGPGLDAEDPSISNYRWLEELFLFFSLVKELSEADGLRREIEQLVPWYD